MGSARLPRPRPLPCTRTRPVLQVASCDGAGNAAATENTGPGAAPRSRAEPAQPSRAPRGAPTAGHGAQPSGRAGEQSRDRRPRVLRAARPSLKGRLLLLRRVALTASLHPGSPADATSSPRGRTARLQPGGSLPVLYPRLRQAAGPILRTTATPAGLRGDVSHIPGVTAVREDGGPRGSQQRRSVSRPGPRAVLDDGESHRKSPALRRERGSSCSGIFPAEEGTDSGHVFHIAPNDRC